MAFTLSCCMNQFHPLPTTSSSITKPSDHQVLVLPQVERSWKTQRRRALGIACTIIIGFQTANLAVAAAADQSMGVIWETQDEHEQQEQEYVNSSSSNAKLGERWSEKRACLPWRINSLETIVPENLPRLEARRKSQSIIHSSENHGHAPPNHILIKLLNPSNRCFSL